MTKSSIIIVLALACLFSNCKIDIPNPNNPTPTIPTGATAMKASPQRIGDATKGYPYLLSPNLLSDFSESNVLSYELSFYSYFLN